jgi:hypothetical protein
MLKIVAAAVFVAATALAAGTPMSETAPAGVQPTPDPSVCYISPSQAICLERGCVWKGSYCTPR